MGRRAALVQRQGGAARDFLLRGRAVVRGGDAPATSRSDFALAGHLRLLSRPYAPGRYLRQRISEEMVEPQRPAQSIRQSRYRLHGYLYRRARDRARYTVAGGARG